MLHPKNKNILLKNYLIFLESDLYETNINDTDFWEMNSCMFFGF